MVVSAAFSAIGPFHTVSVSFVQIENEKADN
jgi:hypothetical protein